MITLLGLPFDEHSSFLRGPAKAPPVIREALHSDSSNLCAENMEEIRVKDAGDLTSGFDGIGEEISRLLDSGAHILSLGGDHAVTYPIVKTFASRYAHLNILQLDAHPDLYDELEGDRLSHACPFARIMEEGLAKRLVQVGVRTMNPHQREQAERFGVEVIDMKRLRAPELEGPVYLSLDLDCLDPAFAPGVSHHEPGGLTTREVIDIIQGIDAPIVGADIVELNPDRDPAGITAMAAAKFLKEIAAKM